jgi:hypothetical protein
MNRIRSFTARLLVAALLGAVGLLGVSQPVSAQTALTSTTTNAAMTATTSAISLTSTTGITAGVRLYADLELMIVNSINTTTGIAQVRRGLGEGFSQAVSHANGTTVYILPIGTASGQAFVQLDPSGSCTPSLQPYLPVINTKNGNIWDCVAIDGSQYHWEAYGEDPLRTAFPRTVVAGVAYTIKIADFIVALSTTGTGTGGTSVAVQTWTLPNAAGHFGKMLMLKDESGGVTATTYVSVSGTVDGVFNVAAVALKTAYGGVTLYAGSGGWFTVGCWNYGCR